MGRTVEGRKKLPDSFAPFRGLGRFYWVPTAYAVGYDLSPLRAWAAGNSSPPAKSLKSRNTNSGLRGRASGFVAKAVFNCVTLKFPRVPACVSEALVLRTFPLKEADLVVSF